MRSSGRSRIAPLLLVLASFSLSLPSPARGESASPPPSAATFPPRTFDGDLPRPFGMALRGATASEAWVAMHTRGGQRIDEGVIDLRTGCMVETLPTFARLRLLAGAGASAFGSTRGVDTTRDAEARFADAATRDELVRFVAAGRRFGQRRLGFGMIGADDVAFSADGRTMLVEASEAVFRSRDGGATFDRLDANMSRYPAVTADGKWVLYERCADGARRNQSCPEASREVRVVAADDSVPPRRIPIGSGLLRGMDPSGQALVVVRYDIPREVTVMHVSPSAGTMTRAFGIPAAPLPPNRFHDIDPSPSRGAFGVFNDNDKHPTSVFTVVSMTDGRALQRFSVRNEMGTYTDDEAGRLMWQTYPDDHAWARRPNGAIQDLGMGEPLGWAQGGRALVFRATYAGGRRIEEPTATLRSVACTLVKVVRVS